MHVLLLDIPEGRRQVLTRDFYVFWYKQTHANGKKVCSHSWNENTAKMRGLETCFKYLRIPHKLKRKKGRKEKSEDEATGRGGILRDIGIFTPT